MALNINTVTNLSSVHPFTQTAVVFSSGFLLLVHSLTVSVVVIWFVQRDNTSSCQMTPQVENCHGSVCFILRFDVVMVLCVLCFDSLPSCVLWVSPVFVPLCFPLLCMFVSPCLPVLFPLWFPFVVSPAAPPHLFLISSLVSVYLVSVSLLLLLVWCSYRVPCVSSLPVVCFYCLEFDFCFFPMFHLNFDFCLHFV